MIDEISNHLKNAETILITAGADMGVDSGLPDFRGDKGFWNAYPVAKKLNLDFIDLANPKWFYSNPELAWAFYGHRYELYKNTVPHKGFYMLLSLIKSKDNNYFIFTSNVDGQFQKAGFEENKIIERHGSINYFQCTGACKKEIWLADVNFNIDMDSFRSKTIPICHKCKAVARPNILMFNDFNWTTRRVNAQEQKYNKWLKQNRNKKMVIIELGAGLTIPTVRYEGEKVARTLRAALIRINPRDYEIDSKYGYSIPTGALKGLEQILK